VNSKDNRVQVQTLIWYIFVTKNYVSATNTFGKLSQQTCSEVGLSFMYIRHYLSPVPKGSIFIPSSKISQLVKKLLSYVKLEMPL